MRAKHQLRQLDIGAVRGGRRRFTAEFEFRDVDGEESVLVAVDGHLTREHLAHETYDAAASERRWVVTRLQLQTRHGIPLGSKAKQYVPLSLVEDVAGLLDLRSVDLDAHRPVQLPEGTRRRVRLTDEFLRSVADSWLWHRLQGEGSSSGDRRRIGPLRTPRSAGGW